MAYRTYDVGIYDNAPKSSVTRFVSAALLVLSAIVFLFAGLVWLQVRNPGPIETAYMAVWMLHAILLCLFSIALRMLPQSPKLPQHFKISFEESTEQGDAHEPLDGSTL